MCTNSCAHKLRLENEKACRKHKRDGRFSKAAILLAFYHPQPSGSIHLVGRGFWHEQIFGHLQCYCWLNCKYLVPTYLFLTRRLPGTQRKPGQKTTSTRAVLPPPRITQSLKQKPCRAILPGSLPEVSCWLQAFHFPELWWLGESAKCFQSMKGQVGKPVASRRVLRWGTQREKGLLMLADLTGWYMMSLFSVPLWNPKRTEYPECSVTPVSALGESTEWGCLPWRLSEMWLWMEPDESQRQYMETKGKPRVQVPKVISSVSWGEILPQKLGIVGIYHLLWVESNTSF